MKYNNACNIEYSCIFIEYFCATYENFYVIHLSWNIFCIIIENSYVNNFFIENFVYHGIFLFYRCTILYYRRLFLYLLLNTDVDFSFSNLLHELWTAYNKPVASTLAI